MNIPIARRVDESLSYCQGGCEFKPHHRTFSNSFYQTSIDFNEVDIRIYLGVYEISIELLSELIVSGPNTDK